MGLTLIEVDTFKYIHIFLLSKQKKQKFKGEADMILRNEIIVSFLGDEYVAVAAEEASEHFHGMIKLNETGAFITECLKKETTAEAVAEALCEKYDVSREKALGDVMKLVEAYKKAGLLI